MIFIVFLADNAFQGVGLVALVLVPRVHRCADNGRNVGAREIIFPGEKILGLLSIVMLYRVGFD